MSNWHMPAETAPQERIWMAFPTGGYTLGESAEEAHAARSVWAAVANAVVDFEPVTVMVSPDDVDTAGRYLRPGVEVLTAELNDAWMRDIGPSFVLDGNGNLGAVDWVFNGWGAQEWASWDKDSRIAAEVAGRSRATHIPSALVNEGGGIQVDGEGTVLITESVQLDPGRNPGLTKADVEAELARTIGATHAIWLPRASPATRKSSAPAGTWTSWPPFRPRARCWSIPSRTRSTRTFRSAARSSRSCPQRGTPPAGSGTSLRSPRRRHSRMRRAGLITATSTTSWSTAGF